ncbi:SapC family protein [Brevundimonas olei]|uniref:SapC family protein n=1 Tax=Brevundimonas olei TaxID=657642 RepID=A0ABZ2I9D7_9CAUL
MTTAPQSVELPVFYKGVMALNSRDHASWHRRTTDKASWLANQHVVPLTVEEFPQAQRHFPVIFSSGRDPIPLALMGMNEGVNVFVDSAGALPDSFYVPAYARRYPFILAKLTPEASELSLCFDPSSNLVGDFAEGEALFDGVTPTDACKAALYFCEQFEAAGQKTTAFIAELIQHDLLMEGEVAIQQDGAERPFVYRGFQMVNQAKLRDLPGDVLTNWNQTGVLSMIFAHLHSLELTRDIFLRQVRLGEASAEVPALA